MLVLCRPRPEQPGIQSAVKRTAQRNPALHARRQDHRLPELGHVVHGRRIRPADRAVCDYPAAIEKDRYYTVQLIDLYTFNFGYLGSRTTGNGGGRFLIAGPDWKGTKPKGVEKIVQSETEIVFGVHQDAALRSGRHGERQESAGRVQRAAALRLPQEASSPAGPEVTWVKPVSAPEQRTSLEFFNELRVVLEFCAVHPSERDCGRASPKSESCPESHSRRLRSRRK